MIAIIGAWACLFTSYVVFAGQASAEELTAGAVCATAAVLLYVGTRRTSSYVFTFDLDGLAAVGRACRRLPRATLLAAATLFRALARRSGGTAVTSVYVHGRRSDPADAGRRAIGVLAASLAPDRFVLRMPPGRDEVVAHAFDPHEPPEDPRWPI